MAFTSWAEELAKFKNAMANRSTAAYFQSAREDRNQSRVNFTKLGNVSAYLEWLEGKASAEAAGLADGEIPFFVAGL